VVLKDSSEKPILVLQKIYRGLANRPMIKGGISMVIWSLFLGLDMAVPSVF